MPKDQGIISNRNETDLRTSVSHWLADVWFGNNKEGVAKARRFVNVIENTPGGIPLWANDITNLVKQGDYKGAAATAALGLIPAKHISRNKFDKFDYKIGSGSGEGTQNEGPGLYFMDPKNTMEHTYKRMFTAGEVSDKKTGTLLEPEAVENELMTFMTNNGYFRNVKDAGEQRTKELDLMLKGTDYLFRDQPFKAKGRHEQTFFDFIDAAFIKKALRPYKYDVNLHADPSELPHLDKSWKHQPSIAKEKLTDMFNDLYNPDFMHNFKQTHRQSLQNTTEYLHELGFESRVTDLPYNAYVKWPEPLNDEQAIAKLVREKEADPIRHMHQAHSGNPDAIVNMRDLYQERGIPALNYYDPDVGTASHMQNQVVFNDDIIEILKRTQLGAVPVGLGSLMALDEEKQNIGEPLDYSRKKIENEDGSFSTERTVTLQKKGLWYNVPSIVNGQELKSDEVEYLFNIGVIPHVGEFNTLKEAEKSAVERSKYIGKVRVEKDGK